MDWVEIKPWRKLEREQLIAARLAISSAAREAHSAAIIATLQTVIGDPSGLVISAYWPFRGEPDLRGLLRWIMEFGGKPALPVVVKMGHPLLFRSWRPGESLEKGIWNIPVPKAGTEVVPDVVIAPVVGFDSECYRLGYGGGFFDRTLATLPNRPRTYGVGYSMAAIPTIYPQPHDVPMDLVVTDHGVKRPASASP